MRMLEQFGTNLDNRMHTVQEQCRVCGDPAAGFHFGVFTCEGCKSFFGRAHQKKLLSECKNKGKCEVNRNTRTKCKLCRLQKCLSVGMSKEASRYGRRSTYFKVHCMAEKQAKQKIKTEPLYIESDSSGSGSYTSSLSTTPGASGTGKLVQYSVEKSPPGNGPARPVPCYPTLGPYTFNPLLYLAPVHLQYPFNTTSVDRKLLSFGSPDCGGGGNVGSEPQSAPLDLSQKSSRIYGNGGVKQQQHRNNDGLITFNNGRSVIQIDNNDHKPFDFIRHHSASNFQGFVN